MRGRLGEEFIQNKLNPREFSDIQWKRVNLALDIVCVRARSGSLFFGHHTGEKGLRAALLQLCKGSEKVRV